jgi:hypothetical protein
MTRKGAAVKRIIAIGSLVLGLAGVAAPVATPAPSDAQGPACGNIVSGDGSYAGALGTGTVDFTIQLAASVCPQVTYSFYVTDTSGNLLASSTDGSTTSCTPEQSGGGCVEYVVTIDSSPDFVCVYATTSIHGHIIDQAPDLADPTCQGPTPSLSIGNGVGASGNFG